METADAEVLIEKGLNFLGKGTLLVADIRARRRAVGLIDVLLVMLIT